MTDDRVFCAKTGKLIVDPPRAAPSNVIPFPRRRAAKPKVDTPEDYAEAVTIRSSGTFADIDEAARAEVATLADRVQGDDDI